MSALDLTTKFYVNFRRGQESVPVFTYNPETKTFTATDWAAGRASMEFVTRDDIEWGALLISGEYVAFWNNVGELSVANLSDSRPSRTIPYLEFVTISKSIPERAATITLTGDLGCGGLSDVEAILEGDSHFALSDSVAIEPNGVVYASPFREINLWTDEDGAYLTDENGNMIELGNISS